MIKGFLCPPPPPALRDFNLGVDRGAGGSCSVAPAPFPSPQRPLSVVPAPPVRRSRLDLEPIPNVVRSARPPSHPPTLFAGRSGPRPADHRRLGPRSSLGRRGLSSVIPAPERESARRRRRIPPPPLSPPVRRSRLDLEPIPNVVRSAQPPSHPPTLFAGRSGPRPANHRRLGPRPSLGRRGLSSVIPAPERESARRRRRIPPPPLSPPVRRSRLDLEPIPNVVRSAQPPSHPPTLFAGRSGPRPANHRRLGPRPSLGRRGLSSVIPAPERESARRWSAGPLGASSSQPPPFGPQIKSGATGALLHHSRPRAGIGAAPTPHPASPSVPLCPSFQT